MRSRSRPAHTGTFGAPPANAVTTSVPPVIDATWTRAPTFSATQWNSGVGNVEPVTPSVRSAVRSWSVPGRTPALAQADR